MIFIATIQNIMSGIVSIYIPTTNFNTSIYIPNQDMTQISLGGTVNGSPLVAYSTIPSGSYNCLLQANFTSGSDEPQVPEQPKKNKFVIKPPQKNSAKSPPKMPLESQVPIGLKQNLYKKPDNIVAQLPSDKDPSGTMSGSYSYIHAPWPSNWNVYLLINYQLQYAGTNVYEFYIASHPDDMTDPYDAFFSSSDFRTIGQANTTSSQSIFNVSPNNSHFFNFTSN